MESRIYDAESAPAEDSRAEDAEQPLPDFPGEALPPILADQARAIAETLGLPLAMSAPMVLATASASLGRGLRLKSLRGQITPANLFILVAKASGSGGSVAFKWATAPLYGKQASLRREFDASERPRLEARKEDLAQRCDALKRELRDASGHDRESTLDSLATRRSELAALEKELAEPLLVASDATAEGMAHLLSMHGECLAHFDSDAADALAGILGRYSERDHVADSMWLKSFSLEPNVIVRKSAPTIHLAEPCLACLFVAVPSKVAELFENRRLTSGGLLARFLVCDPGARPQPFVSEADLIDAKELPASAAQPYEAACFATLETYRHGANDTPHLLEMTEGARRHFALDWNEFCDRYDGDEENSPFAARHTELALRIAVSLHAFRHIEIEKRGPGTYGVRESRGHVEKLDERAALDALKIRDWFALHQARMLAPQSAARDDDRWERARAIIESLPAGATLRDFYSGRRVCKDAAAARKLAEEWMRQGRVRAIERVPDGPGRPTTAYVLTKAAR